MLAQLRRDAAARGLPPPRVAQMDLRALALRGTFATILAPYSLVTYLTTDAELDGFLREARRLLEPAGRLVLDAFVPKDVAPFDDFRLDYRRAHGAGVLERHKRIAGLAGGVNRIERRYRLLGARGEIEREWTTCEQVRPCTEALLRGALERAGFAVARVAYDYDAGAGASPQFATLLANKPV
jgi:hypothetical protein